MSSLSLPDVNVWLALAVPEHVHHAAARAWWTNASGMIAFCRITQLGLLRLLVTAAAMDRKPLTRDGAWGVYERFFEDDRVQFRQEPGNAGGKFRALWAGPTASPKTLADAWLLAFAHEAGGQLVTFDRALSSAGAVCLL